VARVVLPGFDDVACGDPGIRADGRTLPLACNPGATEFDIYVTTREPL